MAVSRSSMRFRRTRHARRRDRRTAIPEGDWAPMHHLSANRGEDAFVAREFDVVVRSDTRHIAFGGRGTHFWLGPQLAGLGRREFPHATGPAA